MRKLVSTNVYWHAYSHENVKIAADHVNNLVTITSTRSMCLCALYNILYKTKLTRTCIANRESSLNADLLSSFANLRNMRNSVGNIKRFVDGLALKACGLQLCLEA